MTIKEEDVCIITNKDMCLTWDLGSPSRMRQSCDYICFVTMGPRAPTAYEDRGTQCDRYGVGNKLY